MILCHGVAEYVLGSWGFILYPKKTRGFTNKMFVHMPGLKTTSVKPLYSTTFI